MKNIVAKKQMKTTKRVSVPKSSITQEKILEYCGYKLVGNKLIATGSYNPIPYQGL